MGKSLGFNKIDRWKIIAFFSPSLLSSIFYHRQISLVPKSNPAHCEGSSSLLSRPRCQIQRPPFFFFASREPVKSAPFNSGNHSGGAVQQSRVRGNAQRWGHCWERMDCFLGIKSLMDTEKLPLMLQLRKEDEKKSQCGQGERIGNSPDWETRKDTSREM